VKSFPNAPLYEPQTLRTYFLEFENTDWEKELSDFHGTDVEVPAKLTVDGKTYQDVGVHFRGMSSYGSVGKAATLAEPHLISPIRSSSGGYRTNLLNAPGPTFLRPVLF
jgi:spore coat protein CotH